MPNGRTSLQDEGEGDGCGSAGEGGDGADEAQAGPASPAAKGNPR